MDARLAEDRGSSETLGFLRGGNLNSSFPSITVAIMVE